MLAPDEICEGREADALVSSLPGEPFAVFAADCALIGLASPEGIVGAVHAGWRGLLAGVIERATAAMREAGASEISAVVGPCIGAECYEFNSADLEPIRQRYGTSVRSVTSDGATALDLRAGVHKALESLKVAVVADYASCTSCDPGWYSWRARKDTGRQALVVASLLGDRSGPRDCHPGRDSPRPHRPRGGGDPELVRIVAVTKGFGPASSPRPSKPG